MKKTFEELNTEIKGFQEKIDKFKKASKQSTPLNINTINKDNDFPDNSLLQKVLINNVVKALEALGVSSIKLVLPYSYGEEFGDGKVHFLDDAEHSIFLYKDKILLLPYWNGTYWVQAKEISYSDCLFTIEQISNICRRLKNKVANKRNELKDFCDIIDEIEAIKDKDSKS